jgi:hypothetical protein
MDPNAPFPGGVPQGDPGWDPYVQPVRRPGLAGLRVRYARGELDRTDFLERSADLGGPPNPDDRTLPGEPPAPDQG